MIGKMILQGLAATVIVAVLAFGYAASAKTPVPASTHSEAAS
ncbi:hypothetical protein [Paramagnetospirillum kuznetsovii]|nr:hypothetical protein [Paramagnetospirillum kuznetsovii]